MINVHTTAQRTPAGADLRHYISCPSWSMFWFHNPWLRAQGGSLDCGQDAYTFTGTTYRLHLHLKDVSYNQNPDTICPS